MIWLLAVASTLSCHLKFLFQSKKLGLAESQFYDMRINQTCQNIVSTKILFLQASCGSISIQNYRNSHNILESRLLLGYTAALNLCSRSNGLNSLSVKSVFAWRFLCENDQESVPSQHPIHKLMLNDPRQDLSHVSFSNVFPWPSRPLWGAKKSAS